MIMVQSFLVRMTRILRNIARDLRFGQVLGGTYITRRDSSNSDYAALDQIFADEIASGDVLVDIGCGYGRVINWWLKNYPEHQLIGIELDQEVAANTQARLNQHANVEIMQGDAITNLPHHGAVFYMYNPFGADTVADLKRRFEELFSNHKRVKIIYYNCKHLTVFEDDAQWHVRKKVLKSHPAAPFSQLAVIELIG